MTRIFLSYASSDRELASRFVEALRAKDCFVWWDRLIQVGNRWDTDIERELNSATCVVVLWTERSRESEWVLVEGSVALKRNLLFPVLVDDAELPLEFLRRQAAKLATTSEERFRESFERIIQSIVDISLQKSLIVGSNPNLRTDWRFSGGFQPTDRLLALPETRPQGRTRYELCRLEIEKPASLAQAGASGFKRARAIGF